MVCLHTSLFFWGAALSSILWNSSLNWWQACLRLAILSVTGGGVVLFQVSLANLEVYLIVFFQWFSMVLFWVWCQLLWRCDLRLVHVLCSYAGLILCWFHCRLNPDCVHTYELVMWHDVWNQKLAWCHEMCESVLDGSLMWMFRSPSITMLLYFVILFARSSLISCINITLVMLLPAAGWYIPMMCSG